MSSCTLMISADSLQEQIVGGILTRQKQRDVYVLESQTDQKVHTSSDS